MFGISRHISKSLRMKKVNNKGIYGQMQRMAELTVTTVLDGKLVRAKKFLDAAEHLLINGNFQTRNAVFNVFLYHVSGILQLHYRNFQPLFPEKLRVEYIRQINSF
jgi:hypothetical protein